MRIWFTGLFLIFIIAVVSAQSNSFSFGFRVAGNLSQIEGDNLRGFKKVNPEIGLLGGYGFSSVDEFQLSLNYESAGSNRQGEDVPLISGNYLAEVDMNQISLFFAYARSFAEDWDGRHRYRAYTGFKMNRIMNSESNLRGATINDTYELQDGDFKNIYWSFRSGISMHAGPRLLLGLFYDHALESVLKSSEEIQLNKLIPFNLGIDVSYYLH